MKHPFKILSTLVFVTLLATSANAQVNLLLNRDYVGKASEKQLMRVIEKGANLNQVSTRYGHTPLTVLVDYRLRKDTKGSMRLIRVMLERGADPNIPVGPTRISRSYNRDWVGSTALHKAVEIGYKPLVTLLLEAGAEPNAVGEREENRTPLYDTVLLENKAIVQLLLEAGAEPNVAAGESDYYFTPLVSAIVEPANMEVARLLLEYGADPTLAVTGETPLSLTAGAPGTKCPTCTRSHANPEVHTLLLQYRK